MHQFDSSIINQLSKKTKPGEVVFLIGENGAGKSRILSLLAGGLLSQNSANIIAISNSPYTRFPPTSYYRTDRYNRHLSGLRNISPSKLIKSIFRSFYRNGNSGWDNQRRVGQLLRSLDYLGFTPNIGFSVDVRSNFTDSYHYNSEQIDDYASRPKSLKQELIEGIEKTQNALHFEYNDATEVTLAYLDRISKSSNKIEWIDVENSAHQPNVEILKALCFSEDHFSNLLKVNIYVQKKSIFDIFLIDGLSSGEKSQFSIINFISAKIVERTWILIDEPENSLHPRWQKQYCSMLLDNFTYFEPKIIIATHSPMIVSGATSEEIANTVYHPGNVDPVSITGVESVESILMDVFDTITPKNHYLSVQAQGLLDKLSKKMINLDDALVIIKEWSSKITEKKQRYFLLELARLATEIDSQ